MKAVFVCSCSHDDEAEHIYKVHCCV